MLRVVGAIFIMAGCTGIGFCYRFRFRESYDQLLVMLQILEFFISEIRYSNATLPECCRQTAGKVSQPYRDALSSIFKQLEKKDGEVFSSIWKKTMEETLSSFSVSKEEKKLFTEFCSCTNYKDRQMQINTLEQCRDLLAGYLKNREGKLEKQLRLSTGLGIMGGLLITVILI